ncbi:Aminotransferase OS=Streptomyces microflavus OX=1919 GN=arcT PE=3 SV=1 [Streptomyces microflavus]
MIVFRPGWQQSWDITADLGCQVDCAPYREDLTFDVEAAAALAGPGLRLIVANSPCNPTGRRIADADLKGLLELAERRDAYLLLDEEYALDLRDSPARSSDRVISVSSLSKVYGFPGLRVGWLYGPPEVVEGCARRKFLSTIANSVLCETLACDVLDHRDRYLRHYAELTGQGLKLVREFAERNADAVQLVEPENTPFAWLRLTTGEQPLALCRRVLDAGVLLMPGETLGASDGFRICFARDPEAVTEGLRRIEPLLRPSPQVPPSAAPLSGQNSNLPNGVL